MAFNAGLFILLCTVIADYGMIIMQVSSPEEKIHFLEYSFLAYMLFRAMRHYLAGYLFYITVLILVVFIGWATRLYNGVSRIAYMI